MLSIRILNWRKDGPQPRAEGCSDVSILINDSINHLRKGKIDLRVANGVGYRVVLERFITSLSIDELEMWSATGRWPERPGSSFTGCRPVGQHASAGIPKAVGRRKNDCGPRPQS